MKRAKPHQIKFYVNDHEKNLINDKYCLTKIPNRSEFILKCILEKPIINLNLQELKDHTNQINFIGKNINQIVSKANSMDTVFENDLLEIKSLMTQLLDSEKQLLKFFIDIT